MANIKNIIFDFGGVIINIDTSRIVKMLAASGIDNLDQLHMHLLENDIYLGLETGRVSPGQFRDEIRHIAGLPIPDQDIDKAWNAVILDIPPDRVRLLEAIRKRYKTFLLSNTNVIHYEYYNAYFAKTYSYRNLADLFDKAYFSHEMGVRKPDPEIYRAVLKDSRIDPGETLFIDDNAENVEAAEKIGIKGFYLHDGLELTSLFENDRLAI